MSFTTSLVKLVDSVVHILDIFTDFLLVLLITESGRVDISNYNLDLSMYFFISISFCLTYLNHLFWGTCYELNCVSQNNILEFSQVLGYL